MFFEPMLRFLILPIIVLVVTLLYPLIGRFYRHFAKNSIRKRKQKLEELKKSRAELQEEVSKKDLTDEDKKQVESVLVKTASDEVKERLKLLTLRSSLGFNRFLTWLARLTSIVLVSFGWTFMVATIGASAAVTYVAIMATVDCAPTEVNTSQGSNSTNTNSQNVGSVDLSTEVTDWAKDG